MRIALLKMTASRSIPPRKTRNSRKRRKPPVEGAVRWGDVWFHPLALLPLEARSWPETVPDEEAFDHAFKPRRCKCHVCKRPAARKWRRRGLLALSQGTPAELASLGE